MLTREAFYAQSLPRNGNSIHRVPAEIAFIPKWQNLKKSAGLFFADCEFVEIERFWPGVFIDTGKIDFELTVGDLIGGDLEDEGFGGF